MFISLSCPCGQTFKVQEEHAGKMINCPACQHSLWIPDPSTPEPTKTSKVPSEVITFRAELTQVVVDRLSDANSRVQSKNKNDLPLLAAKSLLPHLQDNELIELLDPYLAPPDQKVNVHAEQSAFLRRYDKLMRAYSGKEAVQKVRMWKEQIETAKQKAYEKWDEVREAQSRRWRRKDRLITFGIIAGVCILGLATGLARAGVFPWPVAAVIIVAFVVVYFLLS